MVNAFKAILTVSALLMALSMVKVNADVKNVRLKQPKAPPTYTVDGKQVNGAEATIAVLEGKRAFKCEEMEIEASRNGLNLKSKKGN